MEDRKNPDALIVEVVRGRIVESRHQVSMAMVDVDGRLLLAFGEITQPQYLRSSAKPFQALPFIEGGFADQLDFTPRQIALVCASHSGTDEHAELARTLLAKVGLTETSLQCGTHSPYDRATARRLLERGEPLSPLRHNCSGKHAGMLLLSHCLGENLDQYLQRTDKVQHEILQAFSAMVGIAEQEVELGIDGCSAPNFAVTLPASALGYARLMDPSGLDEKRAGACSQIVRAMLSNPEMVAGAGEFDTLLMQVMKGRLLSKGGAEGYQAIGIPTGQLAHGKAAGITLKVHDGDGSKRARSVVCLALLSTLGLLASEEREQLSAFDARPLLNFSQTEVGTLRLASESMARLHLAYERI